MLEWGIAGLYICIVMVENASFISCCLDFNYDTIHVKAPQELCARDVGYHRLRIVQKGRQRSSLMVGGQNGFNSMQR